MNKIKEILKERTREAIIFIVVFAAYNILVFITPLKKNDVFVISYIFALISIIWFAASYFIAFDKPKTLTSKFLSFPIFRIGFIYLVVQLSVSTFFMILSSFIPIYQWLAIVPCAAILAAVIIKTMIIDVARNIMENIAVRQEIDTSFIRKLRVDLEALSARVSEGNLKLKLTKLSEAARYSDPVSSNALAEVESKMAEMLNAIKAAVYAGNNDIEALIDELGYLLTERNKLCKDSKIK